jgi:hypothetical protein
VALLALVALFSGAPCATTLVLPIQNSPEESKTAIDNLWFNAFEAQADLSVARGVQTCDNAACAMALATPDRDVVYCSLERLGTKYVLRAGRVGGTLAKPLSLHAKVNDIESIDVDLQRLSDALANEQGFEESATVTTVTAEESVHEDRTRSARFRMGGAFGMASPVGHSMDYTSCETDGWGTTATCKQVQVRQNLNLTWTNWWEFNNQMALNIDVGSSVGAYGFGEISVLHVPSDEDFSFFVGGGPGLYFNRIDDDTTGLGSSSNFDLGFGGNLQAGMQFFRTYDLSVFVRGKCQVMYTDELHQVPSIDVGLTYHKTEDPHHRETGFGKGLVYVYIGGLVLLGLVGASAAN